MNIVFFGTPSVCIPFLDALREAGMTPSLIVTAPDKPAGRGNTLTPPTVKIWAQEHHVDFVQPEKVDATLIQDARFKMQDTVFVVVAYGYILPKEIIEFPQYKTLNVHFSLLPRWRGASPVESAILAGDTETGCAIQIMRSKLDTGPVITLTKTTISESETTPELRTRLCTMGAQLLVDTLPQYLEGTTTPIEQDDTDATYAPKMKKEDGDITHDTDITRWRKYKAYAQWPQTHLFATCKEKTLRLKITKAHVEHERFIIDRVIPEGKKEMPYTDFLRGCA